MWHLFSTFFLLSPFFFLVSSGLIYRDYVMRHLSLVYTLFLPSSSLGSIFFVSSLCLFHCHSSPFLPVIFLIPVPFLSASPTSCHSFISHCHTYHSCSLPTCHLMRALSLTFPPVTCYGYPLPVCLSHHLLCSRTRTCSSPFTYTPLPRSSSLLLPCNPA